MPVYTTDLIFQEYPSEAPGNVAELTLESGTDFNNDGLDDIKVTLDLTDWDGLVPESTITVALDVVEDDSEGRQLLELLPAEDSVPGIEPLASDFATVDGLPSQSYDSGLQLTGPEVGEDSSKTVSFLVSAPATEDTPGRNLAPEILLDQANWLISVVPPSPSGQAAQTAQFVTDFVDLENQLSEKDPLDTSNPGVANLGNDTNAERPKSSLVILPNQNPVQNHPDPCHSACPDPITGLLPPGQQSKSLEPLPEPSSPQKQVPEKPNFALAPIDVPTLIFGKEKLPWGPQISARNKITLDNTYNGGIATESWELFADNDTVKFAYSTASANKGSVSAHAIAFSGTY